MLTKILSVMAFALFILPTMSAAEQDNPVILQLEQSPGLTFNLSPSYSISIKDFGLGFIGPGGAVYGAGFSNAEWSVNRVTPDQVTYQTELEMHIVNQTLLNNLSQYLQVNLSNQTSLESLMPGLSYIFNLNKVKSLFQFPSIDVNVLVNVTTVNVSHSTSVSVYQNNTTVYDNTNGNFTIVELNYSYQFQDMAPPGFLFLIQYEHGTYGVNYAKYERVAVKAQNENSLHNGIDLNLGQNRSAYYWWSDMYLQNGGAESLYNFTHYLGFGEESIIFFYNMTRTTHSVSEDPYFMVPAITLTSKQISLPQPISHAINFFARHLFLLGLGMGTAMLLLLGGYGVYRKRKIL